ncbi:MAG: MOSC domain-containing protein [Bacillota bacterium]
MTVRLSAINLYPVKSAAGISVEQWPLDEFGLRLDRRWAVIDSAGVVLTQREYAGMAMVRAAIGETALRLEAPGMPLLEVPLAGSGGSRLPVRIWDDTCQAERCAPAVDEWWSALLGEWCHLVRLPDDSFRKGEANRVSFADAFSFLILSEASLDALNARLEKPVPMNRFRPNLVVSGTAPHAEDEWSSVTIGGAELTITKDCVRCVMTTIDQATSARGVEPLRTLASYRRGSDGGVVFGQYARHRTRGTLAVGDVVVPAPRR